MIAITNKNKANTIRAHSERVGTLEPIVIVPILLPGGRGIDLVTSCFKVGGHLPQSKYTSYVPGALYVKVYLAGQFTVESAAGTKLELNGEQEVLESKSFI